MGSEQKTPLESVALFDCLSAEEMSALTSRATLRSFPKNAVLVNEGDETDSLYVINSGKVKIYLSDAEGKEIILTIQGPGDYFGEISLLDSAPRSASAMTLEECKIYVLPKREVEQFLVQHPNASLRIIQGLTRSLRRLTESVRSLALQDVYGRIASTLIKMAEDLGDGKLIVRQRLTHRDIAAMVGSSREMVSRIMKDLSRGGYVSVDENNLIIINKKLPASW